MDKLKSTMAEQIAQLETPPGVQAARPRTVGRLITAPRGERQLWN